MVRMRVVQVPRPNGPFAQFLALCSRSKWSKHVTNSPFLALLAMDGSKAAYKIISACSNAVS
jgi:hypothetical protein